MKTFVAFLATLAVALGAARAQDEYSAVEKPAPKVGWKYIEVGERAQHDRTKVMSGGVVVQEKNETTELAYEVAVEVLEVAGDDWSKVTLAFGKASMGGKDLGLGGKTIAASGAKGERTFTLGGGTLDEDQKKFLEGIFNDKKDDEPDFHAVCFGSEPHAVGESWDMPLEKLVQVFQMSAQDVDPETSTATSRLVSVEEVGETEVGTYEFEAKIALKSINGSIPLQDGWLTMSGRFEWPVSEPGDPHASMTIEFTTKGEAKDVPLGPKKGDITLDAGARIGTSIRPVE